MIYDRFVSAGHRTHNTYLLTLWGPTTHFEIIHSLIDGMAAKVFVSFLRLKEAGQNNNILYLNNSAFRLVLCCVSSIFKRQRIERKNKVTKKEIQ
jgi:hypothetical protein